MELPRLGKKRERLGIRLISSNLSRIPSGLPVRINRDHVPQAGFPSTDQRVRSIGWEVHL
jgi:hypothetical protein